MRPNPLIPTRVRLMVPSSRPIVRLALTQRLRELNPRPSRSSSSGAADRRRPQEKQNPPPTSTALWRITLGYDAIDTLSVAIITRARPVNQFPFNYRHRPVHDVD